MKSTTYFALQSQETRLAECELYATDSQACERDSHPLWWLIPKGLVPTPTLVSHLQLYNAQNPDGPALYNLSCSRFTRRYWGNHYYFLFLRLIICLNSAGLLTSFEIYVYCSDRINAHWEAHTGLQWWYLKYAWSSLAPCFIHCFKQLLAWVLLKKGSHKLQAEAHIRF